MRVVIIRNAYRTISYRIIRNADLSVSCVRYVTSNMKGLESGMSGQYVAVLLYIKLTIPNTFSLV